MSPIPLTKWDSNLNHFRPAAMVPGTAKNPTLVDVHRTKKIENFYFHEFSK